MSCLKEMGKSQTCVGIGKIPIYFNCVIMNMAAGRMGKISPEMVKTEIEKK